MITTICHCDACGERLTQDRTALKILCGRLRGRDPIDLCSLCLDELETFLGPAPGRKPARAAAESSASPARPRAN
jgi:hypothetical protein